MHELKELPAWERMLKTILWRQIGEIKEKKILDFGSGKGITANHFAERNEVIAVEPWEKMLVNRWQDFEYLQLAGDFSELDQFQDNSFDIVFCHNVLEYIDDKKSVVKELARVLKQGGILSIVKHHRAGRIMQMAVLLDDCEKANALLDGQNSMASEFGPIRYYEDDEIEKWAPQLKTEKVFGIRTFWDLQQNQEKHADEEWQKRMIQLEMRVAELEEFRNIAFFHHLLFRKE